jgi:hypothetical protein
MTRQRGISAAHDSRLMTDPAPEHAIRQAIGGDADAIAAIARWAANTDDPLVVVMAAVLAGEARLLVAAIGLATTSRQRQVVEIARAHLAGDRRLVDALARDHLVDHPDSLIVAWIASGAERPARPDHPT